MIIISLFFDNDSEFISLYHPSVDTGYQQKIIIQETLKLKLPSWRVFRLRLVPLSRSPVAER